MRKATDALVAALGFGSAVNVITKMETPDPQHGDASPWGASRTFLVACLAVSTEAVAVVFTLFVALILELLRWLTLERLLMLAVFIISLVVYIRQRKAFATIAMLQASRAIPTGEASTTSTLQSLLRTKSLKFSKVRLCKRRISRRAPRRHARRAIVHPPAGLFPGGEQDYSSSVRLPGHRSAAAALPEGSLSIGPPTTRASGSISPAKATAPSPSAATSRRSDANSPANSAWVVKSELKLQRHVCKVPHPQQQRQAVKPTPPKPPNEP
eukprot:GHVT01075168.1.p1 GENE.GHVT01075168.1~~GHVT01075168.1.p1  ORF type:complete len:269 (-),score=37.33 GHVT01075168.1:330-1136(-)